MGAFEPLDYFKWARELDFVSIDSYPDWHTYLTDPAEYSENGMILPDDAFTGQRTAVSYALTRSLKKQPFLLMESTPSMVNWKACNTLKRPGMHALSSLQAVANGADSVQYFQWRKSLGSSEKFHGAVVGHMYGSDTRVFREVSALGARLEKLAPKVLGTVNRPRAAILFDWDNMWAVDDAQAVMHPFEYAKNLNSWCIPFFNKGIDFDVVDMDSDISGYSLLAAPYNYMYKPGWAEKVREYVREGGTFVTTVWSGMVNESDLCFEERHPLQDVLGIRPEETDASGMYNQIAWGEERYEVYALRGLVTAESAEVLATYTDDFYAGMPALTRNRYGRGQAYYAAADGDDDYIDRIFTKALEDAGVQCPLEADLQKGVTVSTREAADGMEGAALFFVQNFNARPSEILLKKAYRNAENGSICEGAVPLEKYQCLVLEEL
jgi:beta-galactosidase